MPGVRAIANGPIAPDDTVLLIDVEGGALAFADSLAHEGDGELAFMPDACWESTRGKVKTRIAAALRELLLDLVTQDDDFDAMARAHALLCVVRA